MPISFGSNAISAIKFGTSDVAFVYVGDIQVWPVITRFAVSDTAEAIEVGGPAVPGGLVPGVRFASLRHGRRQLR